MRPNRRRFLTPLATLAAGLAAIPDHHLGRTTEPAGPTRDALRRLRAA